MPVENVTANREYPKPFGGNDLSFDVLRIALALEGIDGDVAALLVALAGKAGFNSPTFTGVPQAPTAVLGTNSGQLATTAFVQAAVAALVSSAPGTLDTLNEIAAALGDDENFAATMAEALSLRLRIDAAMSLNDTQKLQGINNLGLFDRFARYDAAQTISAAGKRVLLGNVSAAMLSGYLSPGGLTLSNAADADHDITVAPGSAGSDDADVSAVLMRLAAARTKQADVTFAEGNNAGGMISGDTLPTSGTVHVWLIMKADGTVDVCFSTGLTPTLPTGFVYKRRIGSLRTDASANIRGFIQVGDWFFYKTPVMDISASQGSTPSNRALSVPVGLKLLARLAIYGTSTSQSQVVVVDPDITSKTAGVSPVELTTLSNGTGAGQANILLVMTNASGQVSTSMNGTSATIQLMTTGWVDTRGRLN